MKNDIKDTYKKYKELENKSHDLFSNWIRTIIAISAGLVSVLVSLRQNKSDTQLEHILFSTTIIWLTLGILSGAILLHRQIALTDKHRKWYWERLADKLFDSNQTDVVEILKVSIIYKMAKYIFYLSLTISLLALMVYAVLKDSKFDY